MHRIAVAFLYTLSFRRSEATLGPLRLSREQRVLADFAEAEQ